MFGTVKDKNDINFVCDGKKLFIACGCKLLKEALRTLRLYGPLTNTERYINLLLL